MALVTITLCWRSSEAVEMVKKENNIQTNQGLGISFYYGTLLLTFSAWSNFLSHSSGILGGSSTQCKIEDNYNM